jgi:hypothetical protein
VIEADHLSSRRCAAARRAPAGPAAEFQHAVGRRDVQEFDRQRCVAGSSRAGHDPAGEPTEQAMRPPELLDEARAERHGRFPEVRYARWPRPRRDG